MQLRALCIRYFATDLISVKEECIRKIDSVFQEHEFWERKKLIELEKPCSSNDFSVSTESIVIQI